MPSLGQSGDVDDQASMEPGVNPTEPQEINRDFEYCMILDVPIGVLTMAQALEQVERWIETTTEARLVSFTNVHMVVEARLRPMFATLLKHVDLNCPDGAPVFWLVRRLYKKRVEKISGPDFMPLLCQRSVAKGYKHYLYGGSPGVAEEAALALQRRFAGIQIAGVNCPPFRPLTLQETEEIISDINSSGADVLWVCLGCPKQEQWMSDMGPRLNVKVVLAVGQAFDLIAGKAPRAPRFLRERGFEWLYRLSIEPKRLWKRYLVTNTLFLLLLAKEWLTGGTAMSKGKET